jgi:hypothetical protein
MKNTILLLALFSVAGVAAAATDVDAATQVVLAKTPHGGITTKAGEGLPQGHPDSLPADTKLVNSGTVLDVLDSDMYTYVLVTSEKGPLWLAAYKSNVTKGATVKYSNGVGMSNFFSKALNRSFDLIIFVDSLEVVKK